ncbi:HesA/MoeB/ThiF family protein [Mycoplasma sp. P36-A1]|uniref:HesA/MoeB/ThiF family protein n=1 Tax=Mycoplasma sp. P36-A1 TaxID=3252900 RepID=UPI003C30DA95
MNTRYSRNYNTISIEQQKKLAKYNILVIGLGGLGSHIIEGLTRLGIQNIGICDYDVSEESNINRQLLVFENNLNLPKTKLATQRILDINGKCKIKVYQKFYNKQIQQDLHEYDLIIDCLDNNIVSNQLLEICIKANKNIIYGSIAGDYGYVGVINNDNNIFNYLNYNLKGIENMVGNPYYIVSLVASIQLKLALKVLFNEKYIKKGFYYIDLKELSIEKITFE